MNAIAMDEVVEEKHLADEQLATAERLGGAERRHLDSCDRCRRRLDELTALSNTIGSPVPGVGKGQAVRWQPGDTIDRFVVSEQLGAGGMGVVLAARDPDLDRKVAIKVLSAKVMAAFSAGKVCRPASVL